MSVKVMSEVWEKAPVSGGCLLTLLALADAANDERVTWLGIKKLMAKSRCSKASIYRHVDELQSLGIIQRLTKYELDVDKLVPDYVECAWRVSQVETWESQNEKDESQNETITVIEPILEPPILEKIAPAEQRDGHKEFYRGLQEGSRRLEVRESEYDSWPEEQASPEIKPPRKTKLTARKLAVDFNDTAKVECGGLTITDVPALSGNLTRINRAGIKLEEIEDCIRYFFLNPQKYMFGDQRPWQAFVFKFQTIRKDNDWVDPAEKREYKSFKPVKGSRKIIYDSEK